MRQIGLILLAVFALAQSAAAQSPDRVGPPPQPPRVQAPAAVAKAVPLPMARGTQSFAMGGIGGGMTGLQPMRPFAPLVGLPQTGDQAPLCRATCAKAHNQCSGGGDDSCDANWTQCVSACR